MDKEAAEGRPVTTAEQAEEMLASQVYICMCLCICTGTYMDTDIYRYNYPSCLPLRALLEKEAAEGRPVTTAEQAEEMLSSQVYICICLNTYIDI